MDGRDAAPSTGREPPAWSGSWLAGRVAARASRSGVMRPELAEGIVARFCQPSDLRSLGTLVPERYGGTDDGVRDQPMPLVVASATTGADTDWSPWSHPPGRDAPPSSATSSGANTSPAVDRDDAQQGRFVSPESMPTSPMTGSVQRPSSSPQPASGIDRHDRSGDAQLGPSSGSRARPPVRTHWSEVRVSQSSRPSGGDEPHDAHDDSATADDPAPRPGASNEVRRDRESPVSPQRDERRPQPSSTDTDERDDADRSTVLRTDSRAEGDSIEHLVSATHVSPRVPRARADPPSSASMARPTQIHSTGPDRTATSAPVRPKGKVSASRPQALGRIGGTLKADRLRPNAISATSTPASRVGSPVHATLPLHVARLHRQASDGTASSANTQNPTATIRATTAASRSAMPASNIHATVAATRSPEIDVEELANRVHDLLSRRIEFEAERRRWW